MGGLGYMERGYPRPQNMSPEFRNPGIENYPFQITPKRLKVDENVNINRFENILAGYRVFFRPNEFLACCQCVVALRRPRRQIQLADSIGRN